jgi:hypothetical protein
MSDQEVEFVSGQQVRQLGASEYLVYLLEQPLVRVIEFDGVVDPALMERAFRQMVARRPILRTRIPTPEPGARPFFVIDDSEPPSFSVRKRSGPLHWIDVFNEEMITPLGGAARPPIRAQLLRSDEPGGELLVACMHAVCDGRSVFNFCTQLLREYEALVRGENGDPSIEVSGFSPAVEALLPEWATPERGKELVADQLERQASLPTPMPWPSQRGSSTKPRGTHVLPIDVPADQVSAMLANARANATTMHGVLGACQALATDDIVKPAADDEMVITTTVDIRQRLRVPVSIDDMGIYAATLGSRHSNVSKLNAWDLARDFKTQVAEGIERYDHYTFVFIGEEFVKNMTAEAGDPMMTGALANLGPMEFPSGATAMSPRLIRGAVDISQGQWPFVSLNGVTINGHLAMTAAYQHPEISDDRAHEFVAAMSEHMRWFARNER